MISPSFNFEQFVESVQDKDFHDIIDLAENEATVAWRTVYRKHGSIDQGTTKSRDYQNKLLGLIDYIRHSVKPTSFCEQDLQLFDRVWQNIEKKRSTRMNQMRREG